MPIRCLVIDDEPLARKLMLAHIGKIEGLLVVAECGSAVEGIAVLQKRKVDLVFLDIQMPEITGLQFMTILKNPPAVILTTAHREFALDAFDLDVVDYLLKPISFERLLKAVNKFYEKRMGTDELPLGPVDHGRFIYLRSARQKLKIPLDQILFIESLDDYVKVHLPGRVVVTRENISKLEQRLPGDQFVRVHRSFLVSSAKIESLTAEFVQIGGQQIPFGRAFKQTALKALGAGKD